MKRALYLLLFWVCAAGAQSAALGLYNEGNSHYRNGDFSAAQRAYQQAVDSGIEDARLFYNLANAQFKLGQLGEAILWYERAHRLDPRDEDIAANLRFAHQIKMDRDPQTEENAVSQFLTSAFFHPSLSELALLFAAGWFGLFALGGWRVWFRRSAPLWLVGLLVCGAVAALAGGWLGVRVYHQADEELAIVVADVVTARSGPDAGQTEVFIMHEGTKVRVVRREDDWMLVRLQNGLGGWVRAGEIKAI